MNINRNAIAVVIVLAGAAGYGLYRLGLDRGAQTTAATAGAAPATPMPVTAPGAGSDAAAWRQSQHPYSSVAPAKCPIPTR